MYIVKFFDYGICYLTDIDTPTQNWIFKASEKKAHRFPTIKTAERAYKEWYRANHNRPLHVPVKSLTSIQILQVDE